MSQTMKEIISEGYSSITESRLCEFLPSVVRNAKGEEFLEFEPDLSSMIRQCLDESAKSGMIGILIPKGKILKPCAVINRGGILATEALDGNLSFGARGKKALAKSLSGILLEAQVEYLQLLQDSENERKHEKEEELKEIEARKREEEAKREQEEKDNYKREMIKKSDEAHRALRTGRVFRPEMPEMLKWVMIGYDAANGALESKSIKEFEAEYETDDMRIVFARTSEILDNEIAKRSQIAFEALDSKEALCDFITGYREYLASKKISFREDLINTGDDAFDELFEMESDNDIQLWKVPELLKQIYLGYLASDDGLSEDEIDDCKADQSFDKAVELVSGITTMNIRLGTLNTNPGDCRSEIIRQIGAARKQVMTAK